MYYGQRAMANSFLLNYLTFSGYFIFIFINRTTMYADIIKKNFVKKKADGSKKTFMQTHLLISLNSILSANYNVKRNKTK